MPKGIVTMANLNGTKTWLNLAEAFANESIVRNKYTYFAEQAKRDGYEEIADAFENAANNEKEHARVWFKLLCDDKISKTDENLKTSILSENLEWAEKYKKMSEEAHEEGFGNIAFLFESVAAIEKEHEEIFKSLLQEIEDSTILSKSKKALWVCKICGYSTDSENAPEKCPVCEHPKSYFELKNA